MRNFFGIIFVLASVGLLNGCNPSVTPDPATTVFLNPGTTREFNVLTRIGACAWSLDGLTVTGQTGATFLYAPSTADIGRHTLAVVVRPFGATCTWSIVVADPSDDPGQPGPYPTRPLSYGCNPVRFPRAYPTGCPCDPDPQARTTDISAYFSSPNWYVSAIRGITSQAVPLHARGYMPSGAGPFPLVVVVHGNRMPWELSYYGYDYLTRHLATHGFIALAIEEDFLNGIVEDEIDARGIVILRHFQLLREWNRPDSGHPLAGMIDLDHIALVGHSRGGEAIAAAWYLNTARHDPTDPNHDFNFAIRSLCALAPTDGLFTLDGQGQISIGLHDVDYFVMHGSHDGDVHGFQGMRMYGRAFDPAAPGSGEKAMLFIQRADHAGWNTVWAKKGDPYPVRPHDPAQTLLSPGDQQTIGKTYITAWLKWTLLGDTAARNIIAGTDTPAFLPPGLTMNHAYQAPERVFLDHFEEDTDQTTASWPTAVNVGAGLATWEEVALKTEREAACAPGQGRAVSLAWNTPGAYYRVTGLSPLTTTKGSMYLDSLDTLSFRAGQVYDPSGLFNLPDAVQNFTIRLIVADCETEPVHVTDYAALIPPLAIERSNYLAWYDATSTILDSVRIPLAAFAPDLRSSAIEGVELDFEGAGWIYMDDLQLTRW